MDDKSNPPTRHPIFSGCRQAYAGWDQSKHPDGQSRLKPRGHAQRDKAVAAKFTPVEDPCRNK